MILSRCLLPLLLVAGAVAAEPWTPLPGLSVRPDGGIEIAGVRITLQHAAPGWQWSGPERLTAVGAPGADGTWRLSGAWPTRSGTLQVEQSLRVVDGDSLDIAVTATGDAPTQLLALVASLEGPRYRGGELRLDGVALSLPARSPQPLLRALAAAGRVEIPSFAPAGGWIELTGAWPVEVLDNLAWRLDTVGVRLASTDRRSLHARLRWRAPAIAALDLGAAARTPLRDEVAGDRQGGWTDQGDNDLRCLPPGRLVAAGVPFATADRAIVLGGPSRPWRPSQAGIAVGGRQGACLYLLHAVAWAPASETAVGVLRLAFRDGTSAEIEVRSFRDVADWWASSGRLANAALGWTGDNARHRVGLYTARFAIPDKPIERITLETRGDPLWMVVGAALGETVPLPPEVPEVMAAGPRWQAVELAWEVEPGSALDLSALTPAPLAGRLVAKGGDFVADGHPEQPVRLLGTNLCFDVNVPDAAMAVRIAAGLRRMGHNAVRFHHQDGLLVKPDGDGTELDPERLDRFDRLAAACIAEGLWLTTDLYASRRVPPAAIPELAGRAIGAQDFKALVPLLPSAMDNWRRFAANLLTHRNPYTGRTWAEEPALLSLCLVNEDNLIDRADGSPVVRELYAAAFARWRAEHAVAAGDAGARVRWLRDLQAAGYRSMRAFVRDLGVRAPVTLANMGDDLWGLSVRDDCDLIDNHTYHDHPKYLRETSKLPFSHSQASAVGELLRETLSIAYTRRLDRPFTVTEVNYCQPNHRRAEYAAAVPAVAALQGWGGIWRFAFSHGLSRVEKPAYHGNYELVGDPIALLGERASALLYRRGDVRPAPWSAALVYDPLVAAAAAGAAPDRRAQALALHARVGCLPAVSAQTGGVADLRLLLSHPLGGTVPSGRLPVLAADAGLPAALVAAGLAGAADLPADLAQVRSATGEITCTPAAGRFTVASARSVAAVLPGGGEAVLSGVVLRNRDSDPATVVVAALDDGDLATARRLLVLHLTDSQNSGATFANRAHTQVDAWGSGPVLVRDGALRLTLPGAAAARLWALDLRGVRREAVPALGTADLDLGVRRAWGPCLAWEVER